METKEIGVSHLMAKQVLISESINNYGTFSRAPADLSLEPA